MLLLWAASAWAAPGKPVTHTLEPYTRGETHYRWKDIADNPYSEQFRTTFDYTNEQVKVTYTCTEGPALRGRLVARGLKPNFAYQVKLEGRPAAGDETANWSNRQIGAAGRWWCVEDNANAWEPAEDDTYHKGHTLLGYLLFGFFVTDAQGNAAYDFTVDSSFHVLWKVSQYPPGSGDGRPRTFTVRAKKTTAYEGPIKEGKVSIYAEHEYGRAEPGKMRLPAGRYACRLLLTEESFHSYAWGDGEDLGGCWAHCLSDEKVEFTITER